MHFITLENEFPANTRHYAEFQVPVFKHDPDFKAGKFVPHLRRTTNLEEVCLFLQDFDHLVEVLGEQNNGKCCRDLMVFLLEGCALSVWKEAESRVTPVAVPANTSTQRDPNIMAQHNEDMRCWFNEVYTTFIKMIQPPGTAEAQFVYLIYDCQIPRGWSFNRVYWRVRSISRLMTYMRDAGTLAPLSEQTLKDVCLRIVPERWVRHFKLNDFRGDGSLQSMVHYFNKIERFEEFNGILDLRGKSRRRSTRTSRN